MTRDSISSVAAVRTLIGLSPRSMHATVLTCIPSASASCDCVQPCDSRKARRSAGVTLQVVEKANRVQSGPEVGQVFDIARSVFARDDRLHNELPATDGDAERRVVHALAGVDRCGTQRVHRSHVHGSTLVAGGNLLREPTTGEPRFLQRGDCRLLHTWTTRPCAIGGDEKTVGARLDVQGGEAVRSVDVNSAHAGLRLGVIGTILSRRDSVKGQFIARLLLALLASPVGW